MIDRYKVSDKEKERLMKKLKGDTRKVKAIILLAEYGGHMTREQIANLVGVARMTLWRWEKYDSIYRRELERQYKRQQEHYRKQIRIRCTTEEILGDMRFFEAVMLGK